MFLIIIIIIYKTEYYLKYENKIMFRLTLSSSNHRLYLLKSILCSFILVCDELINSEKITLIRLEFENFFTLSNYIRFLPVIKFEDNFNIQQCISKSKAAVVDVIMESTEVNSPELKNIYKHINE